ncbi:Peptidase A2 domain-containing protein [Methylorubrum populi]
MIWLRQRLLNRMSMRPRLDHARGDVREPARRPCTGGILTLGLIIGACLAGSAGAVAAAAPPRYDKAARGLYLRFLNAPKPGAATDHPPLLGLSFGGATHPVLVDTGSTGIVVSASRIPEVDALPSRPGRVTYSSSGRIMIGRWVTVPVTISGRDGASVSAGPIPVLAIDRIACTEKARTCTPEDAPHGVAMMGIGFGREDDHQSQSTPDTNPLLNARPPGSGPIRRGYVLTKHGVHIGLTEANTRGAYRFVKLDPHPRVPGDWLGVPVCITVNGQAPGACGRALIDTGVSGMFLTLPPAQAADALQADATERETLRPGTRLSFDFGGAADYTIVAGDHASPVAPTRIVLNTTRPQPFVNTGLRALNGFDVLYDADGGYYGFRRRDAPEAEEP